jgi:hypothetical protein
MEKYRTYLCDQHCTRWAHSPFYKVNKRFDRCVMKDWKRGCELHLFGSETQLELLRILQSRNLCCRSPINSLFRSAACSFCHFSCSVAARHLALASAACFFCWDSSSAGESFLAPNWHNVCCCNPGHGAAGVVAFVTGLGGGAIEEKQQKRTV